MIKIVLYLLLILLGGIIGISDSVIGGGTFFTLSLLTIIGLPPINAVATTQVNALVQNLSATASFTRKHTINWKYAVFWGLIASVGAYLGANLAIDIDEELFKYFVITFMIIIFFFVIFRFEKINHIAKNKIVKKTIQPFQVTKVSKLISLTAVSLLLGIYGGFYGAGRGLFLLMSFFFISQKEIIKIAANTKVIDLMLSFSSVFVFVSANGDLINLKYLIPLSIGALFGEYLGVDLAEKFGLKYLKYLIYLVALAVIVKLLFFF